MKDTDTYFDMSLTPRNCSRKGYYWVQDIHYYDNPIYGTFVIFCESFEKGYKLGKAKNTTVDAFGYYVPKRLVCERLSNIFNPMLTPYNAQEYGYKYIDDVIYHIFQPNEAIKDIINLIKNHGYKLGIATQEDHPDSYFGLYMPY